MCSQAVSPGLYVCFQSVSPGLVETQFLAKMVGRPEDQLKLFSRMKALEVEDVVQTVLHLLQTPAHVQVKIAYKHMIVFSSLTSSSGIEK